MLIFLGNECLCTPAPHQPHLGASLSQSSSVPMPSKPSMDRAPIAMVHQPMYPAGYPSAPPYFDPSGQPYLQPFPPYQEEVFSLASGNDPMFSGPSGIPLPMETGMVSSRPPFASQETKPAGLPANHLVGIQIGYSGIPGDHEPMFATIKPESSVVAEDTSTLVPNIRHLQG